MSHMNHLSTKTEMNITNLYTAHFFISNDKSNAKYTANTQETLTEWTFMQMPFLSHHSPVAQYIYIFFQKTLRK